MRRAWRPGSGPASTSFATTTRSRAAGNLGWAATSARAASRTGAAGSTGLSACPARPSRSRPARGDARRSTARLIDRGGCGPAGPHLPRASEDLDDLDLVRDAEHSVEAGDVVEGEVALELELDLALEGEPAVADLDVEVVPGDEGVPDQTLQRGAADLGVLAAVVVEQPDVQLVDDVRDAHDEARVGDRGPLLGEAADGAAQGDAVAERVDGDLLGGGQARIVREDRAHVVDVDAVHGVHG